MKTELLIKFLNTDVFQGKILFLFLHEKKDKRERVVCEQVHLVLRNRISVGIWQPEDQLQSILLTVKSFHDCLVPL